MDSINVCDVIEFRLSGSNHPQESQHTMRTMHRTLISTILILTLCAPLASARLLTPVDQRRRLNVYAWADDEFGDGPQSASDAASASDLGTFDRRVGVSVYDGPWSSSGTADQVSGLVDTRFVARGSAGGSAFGTSASARATSSSTCSYKLSLNRDARFWLTISLSSSGNSEASFQLDHLEGIVIFSRAVSSGDSVAFVIQGALLEGTYLITLEARSRAGSLNQSQISIASFDVDLEFLPEQVEAGTHSMGHLKSSYGPSGKN